MGKLNLCELLKGHEGETFYSPVFGEVVYVELRFCEAPIVVKDGRDNARYFFSNGKYVLCPAAEIMLFPSKDQRDWNKWAEEQKPKLPKTWNEIRSCNVEIWNAISAMDYGPTEPILKSVLALLKIHQLIEKGYGGNITNEEWKDKKIRKYCIDILNDDLTLTFSTNKYIAFHKDCQREEFLMYSENVQLVKEFYQIQ